MSAKIAAALHEVMTSCGYVQKTGKNQFHGYRYAGEADLLDVLRPAMVKSGLLLLPSGQSVHGPDEHGNVTVTIAYTLAHKDGDIWPEKLIAFGAGNDRAKNGTVGDKGLYKAITGANKYLLFKLFQIEIGDDPERDENTPDAPAKSGKAAATSRAPAPVKPNPVVQAVRADILAAESLIDLGTIWRDHQPAIKAMTPAERAVVTAAKDRRKAELETPADDAAPDYPQAAE